MVQLRFKLQVFNKFSMTLFLRALNDLAVTVSIKEIELQDDQKDKKYPIASGQTKGFETNGFNQISILNTIGNHSMIFILSL